jgi:hypothetical protein
MSGFAGFGIKRSLEFKKECLAEMFNTSLIICRYVLSKLEGAAEIGWNELNCYVTHALAVSLSLITLPCRADEVIGTYTVSIDGKTISLLSYANAEDDFSDLTFGESFGIKTYHISASSDDGIPLLDVAVQAGSVVGGLSITNVTFIDQNYDTALAAAHLEAAGVSVESYGAIMKQVIDLASDGTISFAFSADLIRIDLETEAPVSGEVGAYVEVSFSGIFPASELSE